MKLIPQNKLAKQYTDRPLSDKAKSALSKLSKARLLVLSFYEGNPSQPFAHGLVFSDDSGVIVHEEWASSS